MPIKIELFGSALKISLIKFKFSWCAGELPACQASEALEFGRSLIAV